MKSSTNAVDAACVTLGSPGASARIPSIAPGPTWSGRPGETSWSLPQAVFGSQEKLEESAGASCVKPVRSSISRMASGLPVVICWASSE